MSSSSPPSGVKRPLKATSGNSQPQHTPAKRARRKSSAKTNTAVWDVSGSYKLGCANKFQAVDASEYVFNMHYTLTSSHTFQLHASFIFPNLNLTGRMRLCPKSAITSQSNEKLYLSDFEAACELAEGVKPGPKSKEWLMRWRGEEDGVRLGGETRAQGQVLFDEEKQADDSDTPKITIRLAMVHKGKHIILEGTRQDASSEPDENESGTENSAASTEVTRMLEDWKQLYQPCWEEKPPSDTDEEAREIMILQENGVTLPKPKNKWENPRSGRLISTKNKPGPIPGYVINPSASSRYLEDRPSWAWDVTGKYEISTIGLADALGLRQLSEPVPMIMKVQMDNNAKHQKAGRQLWAEIEATGILALARFRPSPTSTNLVEDSVEAFEKACILQPGVWVGPEPQGTHKWEMRWRGFSDINDETMAEDSVGSEVLFTKDDQGKQVFRGEMIVGNLSFLMLGRRIEPVEDRRPSAPTINREWARFYRGRPAITLPKNPEAVIVMDKYCYREFPVGGAALQRR
ncbi:hypothetical protein M426DRAFT_318291 [Hypoxylon sp. CI-4A]|nr:hypothetical protein M426DRAFT_318291 [Hypoxylon sp. CI-4A]